MSETLILIWVAGVIVGALVGGSKGRAWTGAALGLVLGWLGVVIVALMPKTAERQIAEERQRRAVEREARRRDHAPAAPPAPAIGEFLHPEGEPEPGPPPEPQGIGEFLNPPSREEQGQ